MDRPAIRITSKDNQYLKLLRSLHSRKGRAESGLFLVEGLRLAEEAWLSGWPLQFGLLNEDAPESPRLRRLLAALTAAGLPFYSAPAALFAAAAATEHPQGLLLAAKQAASKPLPRLTRPAYYVYLDAVADPGNLGTIMRSAHAAGSAGLILGANSADPYNPKTVRAAMGALFRLPFCRVGGQEEALALFRNLGATAYAAAADGRDIRNLTAALQQTHVWLLGSEAAGVASFWTSAAALRVSLPMAEGAESLNVAAAAAVLFYQSLFAQSAAPV